MYAKGAWGRGGGDRIQRVRCRGLWVKRERRPVGVAYRAYAIGCGSAHWTAHHSLRDRDLTAEISLTHQASKAMS